MDELKPQIKNVLYETLVRTCKLDKSIEYTIYYDLNFEGKLLNLGNYPDNGKDLREEIVEKIIEVEISREDAYKLWLERQVMC